MIVAEIITRLQSVASPPFALIEGAAELAALGMGAPIAMPAAYVFVTEEASTENERVNAVLQRTELDIAVILVAASVADPRGDAAIADIEALKAVVRSALIGWQPPSADDVITSVGGRLVRARDGAVWWEMTLATAIYIGATS